ncbi:MAG: hypothetical protein IJ991_06700 [Thermoguttaceae bacterium]|nr:hypothetical protein [Thermoguttaceae bacterium]
MRNPSISAQRRVGGANCNGNPSSSKSGSATEPRRAPFGIGFGASNNDGSAIRLIDVGSSSTAPATSKFSAESSAKPKSSSSALVSGSA